MAGADPLELVLDDLVRTLPHPGGTTTSTTASTTAPTTAPYEHVRVGLAAAVADGRLPTGTRLPTVRGLAQRLGLAAGTVARAYRELEADAVVRTEGRRGTFVGAVTTSDAEVAEAATAYAALVRRRGLTQAQAHELLDRHWGPA